MIAPLSWGACCTCVHFAANRDDERRMETLPGEHPDYRSPGTCSNPALGEPDDAMGSDTCAEYEARGKRLCGNCAHWDCPPSTRKYTALGFCEFADVSMFAGDRCDHHERRREDV